MNKQILRSLIKRISEGETISVRLRSMATPARFSVVKKSVGRGKGGSLFLTLQDEFGGEVTIGTPASEQVLSMEVAGVLVGVDDERADLPPATPKLELAAEIKAKMRPIVGEGGNGRKVRLTSSFAPLNGVFVIRSSKIANGKFGQVHFLLADELDPDEMLIDFWSYRHSGLIDSFEVLPETDSVPATVDESSGE